MSYFSGPKICITKFGQFFSNQVKYTGKICTYYNCICHNFNKLWLNALNTNKNLISDNNKKHEMGAQKKTAVGKMYALNVVNLASTPASHIVSQALSGICLIVGPRVILEHHWVWPKSKLTKLFNNNWQKTRINSLSEMDNLVLTTQ